jgi:hypothetical protein
MGGWALPTDADTSGVTAVDPIVAVRGPAVERLLVIDAVVSMSIITPSAMRAPPGNRYGTIDITDDLARAQRLGPEGLRTGQARSAEHRREDVRIADLAGQSGSTRR